MWTAFVAFVGAVLSVAAGLVLAVAQGVADFLKAYPEAVAPSLAALVNAAGVMVAILLPRRRDKVARRRDGELERRSLELYLTVLQDKIERTIKVYGDYDTRLAEAQAADAAEADPRKPLPSLGAMASPTVVATRPVRIGGFEEDNRVNYESVERLFLESQCLTPPERDALADFVASFKRSEVMESRSDYLAFRASVRKASEALGVGREASSAVRPPKRGRRLRKPLPPY